MPGRGPTRRRDRARRLRRARRSDRIRPGVRREGGQTYEPEERGTYGHRPAAGEGPRPCSSPKPPSTTCWYGPRPGSSRPSAGCCTRNWTTARTSKRARLLRRARFPVPKTLDGYDFTNVKLPDGYARDELLSLDFVGRAQDLVFYGKTDAARPTWPPRWA